MNARSTEPDAPRAPLLLASRSPRRAALLAAAGIPFEIAAMDVDESRHDAEAPDAFVRRLARAKAEAARACRAAPDQPILAADTIVVVDGDVLGKPVDAADAAAMLTRLSGRDHLVMTGVAMLFGGRTDVLVETTRVWFAPVSTAEIADYVATGEPLDKAGAYAVQGRASRWIARIDGMYSNVVGLPVPRVYRALADAGWMRYS